MRGRLLHGRLLRLLLKLRGLEIGELVMMVVTHLGRLWLVMGDGRGDVVEERAARTARAVRTALVATR